MIKSFIFFIAVLCCSCKQKSDSEQKHDFQANIRWGYKYYSIYIDRSGEGYVTKGRGSIDSEPLKTEAAFSSEIFKIDSVDAFFENAAIIKDDPTIELEPSSTTDSPKAEIYLAQKKIYDSRKWDESFWSLFRPIIKKLPNGFNPFLFSDTNRPFEE